MVRTYLLIGLCIVMGFVLLVVCGDDETTPGDQTSATSTQDTNNSNTAGTIQCGDILDSVSYTEANQATGFCGVPIEVSWESVACATSYQVIVYEEGNTSSALIDEVVDYTTTSYTFTDLATGNYEMEVKPIRTGMIASSPPEKSIKISELPSPILSGPSDREEITESTVTFDWDTNEAIPDNTEFKIEVYEADKEMTLFDPVHEFTSTDSMYTTSEIADGDYKWRVLSQNTECTSDFSGVWFFTKCTLTPTPEGKSEANSCTTGKPSPCKHAGSVTEALAGEIVPSWTAVAGATSYEIQVDSGTDFITFMSSATETSGTCTGPFDTINSSGTYYWRVRATNGTLYTPWSTPCEFDVP